MLGVVSVLGGIADSISDNKLVITSRLPDGYNGAKTSISCSTADSSFLKDLNTTKNPASLTTTQPLASSITIDGIPVS